jgi:hypothetical protein
MGRPAPLTEAEAVPVVDVLPTIADLRGASDTLLRLQERRANGQIVGLDTEARAEAYVRELTERVQSRARSAGMAENELLALAFDVLDGRRSLPEGVSVEEPA